jgi:hypothetical protein
LDQPANRLLSTLKLFVFVPPPSLYSDAVVVAAGSGRGAGGLTSTTVADGLGGSTTSTCSTNWAAANTAAGVTSTTPATATSTGTSGTPSTATADVQVPLNGDSLRILSAPSSIDTSGTFTVTVSWSALGSRVITVDILRTTNLNW